MSSDLKQHKDSFRSVALDRLERELTSFYDSPHRGEARSRQRQSSLDYLVSVCTSVASARDVNPEVFPNASQELRKHGTKELRKAP